MFTLCPCTVAPSETTHQCVKNMPVCFCGLPMDDDLHSPKKSPSQMTHVTLQICPKLMIIFHFKGILFVFSDIGHWDLFLKLAAFPGV